MSIENLAFLRIGSIVVFLFLSVFIVGVWIRHLRYCAEIKITMIEKPVDQMMPLIKRNKKLSIACSVIFGAVNLFVAITALKLI